MPTTDQQLEMPPESWRLLPHQYAEEMSKDRHGVPQWKPYDYLQYVGTIIAEAVFKGIETGVGGRIIVEIPVRHGKSELCSKWVPMWYLDLLPDKRVALATYEADFAAHWGRKVRNEIQENERIAVDIRQDTHAANRWETPEGGGMVTVGVGGPLTGRGFDLGIVDDPVKNWIEATSHTYRENNKNWFKSVFLTRAEPGATIVILMARWHEDDLAGWLQSEHGDEWTVIRLPAIAEADDPIGRALGEALCPDRYTATQLVGSDGDGGVKKAAGPIVWNGLYQQRPSSLEGNVIKRHYFRYWTELPKDANGRLLFNAMALSIDCAFAKTDDSSFVVIGCWGRKGADCWLVDQVRERMDFIETIAAIKDMAARWPGARLKLIEGKANGEAVISSLRSKVGGLVKYMPRGSKIARLASVSPFFASGNVYVPAVQICPWTKDYVEELVNMPNSPNDDQADQTSQMLDHWFKAPATVSPGSTTRKSVVAR